MNVEDPPPAPAAPSRRASGALSRRVPGALSRRVPGALSRRVPGALSRRLSDPVVGQFVRYGVVGITNTVLFLAAYAICVHIGVWYIASSAIGYTLGSINGYVLNRRWTFRAHALRHTTSASRYALVQIVAALGNVGLLYLFVDGIGGDRIVGQAVVIVIVQVLSFVANRAWSFAHRGEDLGEPEVSPPVIVPPAGVR
jgi:putative flippase GtrA